MDIFDGIRQEVGKLRAAIQALVERAGDNPSPEQAAAIVEDLKGLTTIIDSLDPDVPGGVVEPPVNGGTETPPQ